MGDSKQRKNENGDLCFSFRILIHSTLIRFVLVFGVRNHIIVGARAQKLTKNGQRRTILVLQRRILTNLLSSVAQKRERRPIFFSRNLVRLIGFFVSALKKSAQKKCRRSRFCASELRRLVRILLC